MQRYHGSSCTSAVNNNALGGISNRDTTTTARNDSSSSLSSNYSLNSRRALALVAYRLKCEKESLNSRLGPPDFHPQTLNCPEETLTKEYVQSGYRETVEGLEEAKEISVTQVSNFSKPAVLKCKEAIRKRLRAINESRAQKRKAGQVYGEPLSGSLLSRPGVFPEQKSCGEDFKKRWIEGLSQYHKSLRSLADHVPQGYRKKSLFEVLIRNNVPLLRATWFIKVTYLNQVRPGSSSVSSGSPDRMQVSRTEIWTKDVTDYLQCLLDEFFSRNNSHSILQNRDRSQPMLFSSSAQQKSDPASLSMDSEEPSLHFKWWYVVRILNWHHSEGLILPSQIIDWVFLQFQDKDLLQVMQFLLPIIYGVLETITSCQTYVRKLVDVTVAFLKEPSMGGSDIVDNSWKSYTCAALAEMLQYLILTVPDTFVGLDCFPLPHLMMSTEGDGEHTKSSPGEVLHAPRERANVKYPSSWFRRVVSSIQKRASYLAKAASPGYSTQNVAKAVQALDKALVQGDVHEAYKFLFEGLSDSSVHEGWIGEVSPCLRSSLKRIRSVNSSLVYSVFLLCEWCTCDFRDFRTSLLHDIKFTGRKDFSQLYVAVRLMKLKLREIHRSEKGTKGSETRTDGNFYGRTIDWRKLEKSCVETSDFFESPGPLHDIIVCWMDQHEAQKAEGSKRVQLLLIELTRSGIFSPLAYARQLLVSGIMDRTGPVVDLDRRKRHHRILKQLSVSCMQDVFDEAENADRSLLLEAMHVYSNERRLILRGLLGDEPKRIKSANSSAKVKRKRSASQRDHSITPPVYQLKSPQSLQEVSNSKSKKDDLDLENLKSSILELLLLPKSAAEVGVVDSQVGLKRSAGVISSKLDNTEGTPGCEECQRAKRHKLGEDKYSLIQGPSSNALDDEDNWWARKEPKSMDSFKVDPPVKPSKQATRGRQKSVRKTQSLAQLAASRIEGSQGASTSHVCDNKVGCPHHRPVPEGEALKSSDGHRSSNGTDIVSIGKMLKHLKFAEKRNIAAWLISSVKQVVEETERISTKGGQLNRTLASVDEKSSARWKLGEDELSVILYLMDMCTEVPLAIKFLIWLFPKALGSLNTPIHGGRNIMMVSKNVESAACEVKEPFLLSAIRRYENVIAAVDLIPDILSSAMQRAAAVLASNSSGRLSGSPTFLYARHLLKKYGNVSSVKEWEKTFKATCDKRFTAELESSKLQNGEFGFSFAVPAGVVDLDDFIRQKISGNRMSRTGSSMRESVQRHVDEAVHHLFGKERKLFGPGAQKNAIEKWDDGYQIAQQIISALMEFMRQTGGAAQEGDPSLVSSAVSAIVSNVGPAIAKMPDFTAVSNHSNFPAPTGSLSFARRVLRIHINCLCLLKEALGERHSRAFEIALATEASSTLAGVLQPGKGARGQFQLSPDAHDSGVNVSNDVPNNSTKVAVGRATKTAAAVSALIIGAIIHGVSSLERMVTVFRLREGLDLVQFVRSSRSHSNGNARASKVENALEVYIHWFRLLVGNCRTVSDGVIVDLLGEPSVLALSRMQRTLPLKLVLPPAYSLFAFMVWRSFIFNFNGNRDEMPQLLQSLTWAISDAIKHTPFRDICLRDTHGFFDLVTSDPTDADFAAILELNGSDRLLKAKAFIPLRARLFLNALVDCKLPHSVSLHDDGSRLSGVNDSKVQYGESETKISDRLVRALDTLQLAKFHWQWVELRLFLSELTLIGKLDSNDTQSVAEAIRSLSPNPDKGGSLENENNFIPIVLTRLLARPDAAPLLSEVVHLFGRSLEDSMLLHVKWFLEGHDVLFGKKSIRQRLLNFAESKSFSTKAQFWRPWGWCNSGSDALGNRGEKRKFEIPSVEEGEVVEDDYKRHVKSGSKLSDRETLNISQQFVTERALVELVLPCIDRSSDDSRIRFASELIKQMNNIEQQLSGVASGSSKLTGSSPSGTEVSTNKASNRKSLKGSSPGLARRSAVVAIDSAPSSPAALRASVSLRLQLLVRLLPNICADGDSSGRSSRFWLASVILRLLGNRVVYEDMDLSLNPGRGSPVKEAELQMETCADVSLDLSGKNLFDWLLLVLHALLSSSQPSWLRLRISSKTNAVSSKDFTGFDREALETLQSELDRMQVPDAIRWRIQAAMPVLAPNPRTIISCHPPPLSSSILASLQPSVIFPPNQASSLPVKNSVPPMRSASVSATMLGKSKSAVVQSDNNDIEVDPWMLLEDGAGCGPSSSNTAVMGGGDQANLKASSWLKGAVRVRRTDLTYIGAVDGDS